MTRTLSNWRSPPRPIAKSAEQGGPITGDPGKSAEGERVADGSVVAMKRGNARGAKGPCCCNSSNDMGGKGEMIKAPIRLQDLRRRIYVKAKAEPTWRFWGLYVHVCKMETLQEAYAMAKRITGHRALTASRSRPSRRAEWRGSSNRFGTNCHKHVSAHEGTEEGDTEGWGKSPHPLDSFYPGPRGPGSTQADPGTDLRS